MNDLISRQAAIDEIDEWIKAFRENVHKESAADARFIRDGIIQLPSAQPERNGEWIDEGDPLTFRCSKCGYRVARYNNTNFCPNCGADMRGEE